TEGFSRSDGGLGGRVRPARAVLLGQRWRNSFVKPSGAQASTAQGAASQCPVWVRVGRSGPSSARPLMLQEPKSALALGRSGRCHLRTHAVQQIASYSITSSARADRLSPERNGSALSRAGPDERRDSRLDSGRDGVMTLAVMTRASLGHTGSALGASRPTEMIYALVVLSAGLRIMASFFYPGALVLMAALAWAAGFVEVPLAAGR